MRITQQPARRPWSWRKTAPFSLRTSNARAQKCSRRMSPSHVEQVVADVHPRHRQQVAADDAVGDEGGHLRGLVAAVLDVVQRVGAVLQPRLVRLVPLGDPRVEVPAVVVEPRRVGDLRGPPPGLLLELAEADDDVGHLHAGVVDVVLDLDGHAAEPQDAHQRVAERRVAEVPDVRRLVRVDGGVLDDRLDGVAHLGCRGPTADAGSAAALPPVAEQERRAVEEQIEVTVRGLDRAMPGTAAERARRFPRRSTFGALRSRWASSNASGQGEVAEFAVGRVVDHDRRNRSASRRTATERGGDAIADKLVDWEDHRVFAVEDRMLNRERGMLNVERRRLTRTVDCR